jgi:CBS domain-containing protein
VSPDDTLRDALSRMLGMGFRSITVTDDADRLVGAVSFPDIEAAMAERGSE